MGHKTLVPQLQPWESPSCPYRFPREGSGCLQPSQWLPLPTPQNSISPRNLLNTLNQTAWDLVTILPGLAVLYTHIQFNKYRVQVYQSQLNKYGVYGVCTYSYKNLGTGILVRNVVSVITLFLGKKQTQLTSFLPAASFPGMRGLPAAPPSAVSSCLAGFAVTQGCLWTLGAP